MENFSFLGLMIAALYPAFILVCTFFILRRAGFDHMVLMFIPIFQDVVFFLAAGFWKWPILLRVAFLFFQFWYFFSGAVQVLGAVFYITVFVGVYFLLTGIGLAVLSVQMGRNFWFGLLSVVPIIQLWVYGSLAFGEVKIPGSYTKDKTKVINSEKLESLLRDCLDQGMTDAQILDYTKEAKISVAQVKRMLFDLKHPSHRSPK